MQPIRTIWTILVVDHLETISVEFGQIPISVSRKEVVWRFPYIIECKIVTPGQVHFNPRGIIWTTLVEDLYMTLLYTKYESSGPCSFRQEDFWKLHFKNLFFDPVTYLCNQVERFEQIWRETPRDHSYEVWSNSNELFQKRRCLSIWFVPLAHFNKHKKMFIKLGRKNVMLLAHSVFFCLWI